MDKISDKYFFSMLSRMKNINRWGLMRNTNDENLSEHSLDTAVIAHILAIIKNKKFNGNIDQERVAVLAIFHDATEVITGDLPTPVKYYNDRIRKAYAEIEENAQKKLLSMLPDYLQDEYKDILCPNEKEAELWKEVKAADKLSALIKCIQERNMGNNEFENAYKSIYNSIKNMNMPEVDYFIKNFLPAYSLTLDEQQ